MGEQVLPSHTAQTSPPNSWPELRPTDSIFAATCALLCLVVYLSCLPISVTGEDSGELITAAYTVGVAHPSGYPLWCILGKLATLLPLSTVAWRVAFLSASLGALTTALVFLTVTKLSGSRVGGAAAALLAGLSGEFWEQSVIAEVYTLNSLLVSACVLLLLLWYESRRDRWLYMFAVCYGLGLCNHHTMALLGPVFVAFVVYVEPRFWLRWRVYAWCTLMAVACLSLYAYLPIRSLANPPVDWGNPETWQAFKDVVTRQQYKFGFTEHPRTLGRFATQLVTFLSLYSREFTLWLCWLPLPGVVLLWRRSRSACLLLLAIAVTSSVGLILILNFDTDRQSLWLNNVFWIPAYLMAAAFSGVAVGTVAERQKTSVARRFGWVAAPVIAALLLHAHYVRNDKSSYLFADDFGRNILSSMEQDALYLPGADHATFPVLYLQVAEGFRTDVTLGNKYGYPEESLYTDMPPELRQGIGKIPSGREERLIEDWIVQNTEKPVYFSTRRDMSGLPGYRLVHDGVLYRVLRPGEDAPTRDPWEGYSWHTVAPEDTHGELTADYILSDYYFHRGQDAVTDGKSEEALENFEQAASLAPDNKEMLNNVGSALAEHGELENSERYLLAALRVDPGYTVALRNLGKLYLEQDKPNLALIQFEHLVKEDPEDLWAVWESAKCMVVIEWYDQAIKRLEYLLAKDPSNAQAARELGRLYLSHLHDRERAVALFQYAMKLDPSQDDLAAMLEDTPQPPELPAGVSIPMLPDTGAPSPPTLPTPGPSGTTGIPTFPGMPKGLGR